MIWKKGLARKMCRLILFWPVRCSLCRRYREKRRI